MQEYETTYIVAPEAEESIDDVLQRVEQVIGREGGTVGKVTVLGKRRLAYPLDGREEGIYVNAIITGEEAVIGEIKREFIINENILRGLVLRRDKRMIEYAALQEARAAEAAAAAEQEAAEAAAALSEEPERTEADPVGEEQPAHTPQETGEEETQEARPAGIAEGQVEAEAQAPPAEAPSPPDEEPEPAGADERQEQPESPPESADEPETGEARTGDSGSSH